MLGGDAWVSYPRSMTGGSKQDLSYGFNLVPAWVQTVWPGVRGSLSLDFNSVFLSPWLCNSGYFP